MSIELLPFGVACNIQCQYCYEDPLRDAGNVVHGRYDMAKMKEGLRREGYHFALFGGEPLLLPLPELEELFRFGLEEFGPKLPATQWPNGVQTNGTLITPAHVALFRQYKVNVGISLDGPGELNDARWVRSLEETRAATAKTEAAIRLLCADGNLPSIHTIVHRLNASPDRLPQLLAWFRELDQLGIRWVTLHALEVDHPLVRERLLLEPEQVIEAFLACAELERELAHLRFDVFGNISRLLAGDDREVQCTWHACDPYTTNAVHGVDGQGERTNCARVNKDGVNWRKADQAGRERQLALYHTPQEHGGCQGCRFFAVCLGQCPGTAIGGDWRNRSEGCPLWMALFEHVEARMVTAGEQPISLRADRAAIERRLLTAWGAGHGGSLYAAVQGEAAGAPSASDDGHGDQAHGDQPHGDAPHGDAPHGDAPHGDAFQPLGVAPVGRPA